MAISNEMSSTTRTRSGARHGMAFFVEALVIMAFLMMSLAVFVQLFATAQLEGASANRLSEAVLVATNRAEEFSADPVAVQASTTEGDFEVTCDVTPTTRAGGTYYEATIHVLADGEQVYELQTARYVTNASGGEAT